VLEEEFVRLLHEFAIRGEFYFGFWAVAGAVENKDPLHRHFYVAFEVRNGVASVERNTLLPPGIEAAARVCGTLYLARVKLTSSNRRRPVGL
jgi:hypothetical protein